MRLQEGIGIDLLIRRVEISGVGLRDRVHSLVIVTLIRKCLRQMFVIAYLRRYRSTSSWVVCAWKVGGGREEHRNIRCMHKCRTR